LTLKWRFNLPRENSRGPYKEQEEPPMKDTAKKNRSKEAARSPLRTTLGELATRTQLELELESLVRRDLREFVISAGISALTAVLEEERTQAVGPRYAHLPTRRARRAGTAPGELVMGGRRVQVRRPRARTLAGKEIQLPSWTTFGAEDPLEQRAVEQMLVGVSTRRYARSLEPLPEKLPTRGTSRSAVSRRFVAATERQMAEWLGRDVSELDLGVLMIDGVTIDNHVLLVALGIDADGKKHVLGVREGATENAAACTALLADLRERGLRTDRTTLVVIDGSKALAKAVRHVFGDRAIVQRCQAHKSRNVLDQLPDEMKPSIRQAMRDAYAAADADRARTMLTNLVRRLRNDHPGAASSLEEGLDETLAVKRLRLPKRLERQLSTTNAIENLMGSVRRLSRRVKRWRGGKMILRWTVTAVADAATRFRRIMGAREGMTPLMRALASHENSTTAVAPRTKAA
jgi:putative transposase